MSETHEPAAVNRRRLIRRAGTVAAGLGAAGVAAAVTADPAAAADGGNVVLGNPANTADAITGITSGNTTATFVVENTGNGVPLVLTPNDWNPNLIPADGSLGFPADGPLQYAWTLKPDNDPTHNVPGRMAYVYDTSWASMPIALSTPVRIVDTRVRTANPRVMNPSVLDSQGRLKTGATLQLNLSDLAYLGLGVFGVLAAIGPDRAGWLKLFPLDKAEPGTSNVNFAANQYASNSFFVGANYRVDAQGHPTVTTGLSVKALGNTHVILDVTGFSVAHKNDVAEQNKLTTTAQLTKEQVVTREQIRATNKHPFE